MVVAIHLEHAAELVTEQGPTGEFVEVIRGEIHDAGGNVLFAGTADECVREFAGAENRWSYAR